MRGTAEANLAHLDGAGVSRANLLTRATAAEEVRTIQQAAPGRFVWFASADPSRPENADALTQAVKNGARGFGEMKFHYAADGPEFRRARGGITDRLLSDYPNLYGDLSANSGNNMLSRDADSTRDFVRRHQNKLMFGSDCSCSDGHGAGVSQANNPAASRLAGKCVARETLTVLRASTAPDVFRKVTWENVHRLL